MSYSTFSTVLFSVLMLVFSSCYAQVSIDQSYTPEELVQDFLVGSGVTVSNVTFNGIPGDQLNNQLGLYSGPSNFVEFDEGLVMATSDVQVAVGMYGSINLNISGDPDLYSLANIGGTNYSVNTNAILEFDFVPDFEFLTVGYVFGSLEYPSFTCSAFNDVFGFFVSGPGISGQFTNNAVNIAVIPNTEIPVGINTVNSGTAEFHDPQNCLNVNPNFVQDSIYFVSNDPPLDGDIQFPGMTVNLYANYILQVGETYHIKLAIANVSDAALNSGVFLEGASFSAFPLTGQNDQSLLDGMQVNLFPNPASDVLNVNITTENSASLSMRVIDLTGKTVLQPNVNVVVEDQFQLPLDITALAKGSYFLELTNLDSGTQHTARFQRTH